MSDIDQDDDEGLMALVNTGDHQAFSALVRRHSERFYHVAYRMCGQQDEAEDIVQEAFLKLWHKPGSWNAERGAKFTTWFYRVVTNQALDFVRKKKPLAGGEAIERFVDESQSQVKKMQVAQEQDVLEEAIQNLPERQKTALNLCFYEELSNKEAADIMGVGVKALESLLMRAKAGLRDELTRRNFIGLNEEGGNVEYG